MESDVITQTRLMDFRFGDVRDFAYDLLVDCWKVT